MLCAVAFKYYENEANKNICKEKYKIKTEFKLPRLRCHFLVMIIAHGVNTRATSSSTGSFGFHALKTTFDYVMPQFVSCRLVRTTQNLCTFWWCAVLRHHLPLSWSQYICLFSLYISHDNWNTYAWFNMIRSIDNHVMFISSIATQMLKMYFFCNYNWNESTKAENKSSGFSDFGRWIKKLNTG